MCQVLEDMRNEAAEKAAEKATRETERATAKRMINGGKMSFEEIASYVPSLSVNELKKIAAKMVQ